jgi:hypothetical protein
MRPKLQKQSALKLAGRTIPQSGGFNTPQLAAEFVSKACFVVHTRDSYIFSPSVSAFMAFTTTLRTSSFESVYQRDENCFPSP